MRKKSKITKAERDAPKAVITQIGVENIKIHDIDTSLDDSGLPFELLMNPEVQNYNSQMMAGKEEETDLNMQ